MSENKTISISKPNMQTAVFPIRGTSPLVQHKFSRKAIEMIKAGHELGQAAKNKKKREPRDFDADCLGATYISEDGWEGVPAHSFRNAMIAACRVAGFVMTKAKLSVFVEADGRDADEGTPLVMLHGQSEQYIAPCRNQTGVIDLRSRPMWREWDINLCVKWDADQFTMDDVTNLLMRAGEQVGIGEGRHNSKSSNGLGFGCFQILDEAAVRAQQSEAA